jgi:hypothetical protein
MEELEDLSPFRALAEEYVYPTEEEQLLKELRTIKKQVLYLLERFPASRNNDFYLEWLWLKTFPKIDLPWLQWEELAKVSGKTQTVSRLRRRIQNEEGKFLPTIPEVLRKRRERSRHMRKAIKQV